MMKKSFSIFILFIFTLYADEPRSVKSANMENLSVTTSSSVYTVPDFSVREKEQTSSHSNNRKILAAVIGTLTAITFGLFISGRNTGKHDKSHSE